MTKKRWLIVLALLAVLLAAAFFLLRPVQVVEYDKELLKNGGFESVSAEELPEHWLPEAYLRGPGTSDFALSVGKEGRGIRIDNRQPNDARFVQTVKVQPNTTYRLQGLIKADAQDGRGANLSIEGIYVFSDPVYDTQGAWQTVTLYGKTGGNQRELTVFARLGGYSGESTGTATFDDLSLMAVKEVPQGALITSFEMPVDQPAQQGGQKNARSLAVPLTAVMVLMALIMVYLAKKAEGEQAAPSLSNPKVNQWALPMVLVLAFASRVLVAAVAPGFPVDIGCFTAWADQMAAFGPSCFYIQGTFSDYPPGYMLVLWPLGLLGRLFGTGATALLVKLPSILCDALIVLLLYRLANEKGNPKAALWLSGLYALNPLTYLAGAAWGQADSVPSLLLLLCVLFIIKKQWRFALPVYVLAVLMKPQALMVGPLGLLALVMRFIWQKEEGAVKDALLGVGASLLVAAVVVLPFFNEQNGLPWLFDLYGNTMGFYSYATVNATNLFFLFGKNWVPITQDASLLLRLTGFLVLCLPIGWWAFKNRGKNALMICLALCLLPAAATLVPMNHQLTGVLLMVSVFLLVACAYIRGQKEGHLPLLAGVLLIGFSVLGTMMHERYLFLAVALLSLAYIKNRDRRLLVLLLLTTALCFLNTGVALDRGVRIGGGEGNLSAPELGLHSDSAWLEFALSGLSLLVTALAAYLGFALTAPDAQLQTVRPLSLPLQSKEEKARELIIRKPRQQTRFDRKDALMILIVTLLYAVLAFVNLGSTKAPQTAWESSGEPSQEVVLDLGERRTFKLQVYAGINWPAEIEYMVSVSDDQLQWIEYPNRTEDGDCFAWRTVNQHYTKADGSLAFLGSAQELTGRYLRLSGFTLPITLMEVVPQDLVTGENLNVTALSKEDAALVDEQDTLQGPPTWFNSMYFDEIYHGRTAYEQRNAILGQEPSAIYETSHPPLGKVFMTFSVMFFGMTPFGWRFAGALAGVLMLPGLYLLGKQLFRRRYAGLLAMLLFAFDFMHFTQTRIATIDSFGTLFTIYAYFFMYRYVMQDRVGQPFKKVLPALFLSGLMMGLAFASKWTGAYAGMGLAVLFFYSLVQDIRLGLALEGLPESQLSSLPKDTAQRVLPYQADYLKRAIKTCLFAVLFFVLIPALIYYLSYLPVFMQTPGGLTINKVIKANIGMYNYHSQPGLGADHPWSSPWYTWPLMIKPMYYYSGGVSNGTASTIMAFGNPAVWWTGLLALIFTLYPLVKNKMSHTQNPLVENQAPDDRPFLLLVGFAAQYVPWMLVPRGTYIYHYFPSVPFIILCVVLALDWLSTYRMRLAKAIGITLVVLSLVLFVAFFPYLSGVRVSTAWLDAVKWFPNWIYY